MQGFEYRNGTLHVEGVSLETLAQRHGTPLYVYSKGHLVSQFRALADAMAEVTPLICYSVKANSNGAVIRTFAGLGGGFDIVSGGELYRALRAGADPSRIVFAGVGKTVEEIRYALRKSILFFTVESEPEVQRISRCAVELGVKGRIAFRVNPDVDPKTHQYISTGKKENKFGLDIERTERAYAADARLPGIEVVGVHMHIGSQILTVDPFVAALDKVLPLCRLLRRQYASLRYLDIGGGIGIQYRPDQIPLLPRDFAAAVLPRLRGSGMSIVMEPGRYLVGNAGLLLCRVQYVKDNPLKRFVIVDAGMNDLIRPSLYQAYHEVMAVHQVPGTNFGDLVGPICESGDFIAADRELPSLKEGDLVAVMSAGAYGFAMASTYNSRPNPAEVMVDGAECTVIRTRGTVEDLVTREV